jgi:tetratricopeptide (TPR) repeat protein
VPDDPAAHAPLFSQVLTEKAALRKNDRRQTLALAQEIVDLWERVVKLAPDKARFAQLASAHANLARHLLKAGLRERSVRAAQTLVELNRDLMAGRQAVSPAYATALSTAAQIMVDAGKPHLALNLQTQRLAIDRRAAARDFRTHGWALAGSLLQAGHVYRASRHPDRVRAMAREAVSVARRMQRQWPDADSVRLSKLLVSSAFLLASVDAIEDTLPLLAEAVRIRRESAPTEEPAREAMLLARALGYHADALAATGDWAAALPLLDEAFVLAARALAEFPMDRGNRNSKTDTQEFYTCLVRLNGTLERLGMPQRAEAIRAQGMEVLTLLVERYQNSAAEPLLARRLPAYHPKVFLRGPGQHWLMR